MASELVLNQILRRLSRLEELIESIPGVQEALEARKDEIAREHWEQGLRNFGLLPSDFDMSKKPWR